LSGAIAELFEGAIDVIGDVHGESEALFSLVSRLGYDASARHPDGRRLVFLGDLIDRGPDSPAVLRRVASWVEAGRAQCLLGNHELNALRDDPAKRRGGEGWWYGRDDARYPSVRVEHAEKQRAFLPFLAARPVALERKHLRIVHACWHEPSVEQMREEPDALDAFRQHDAVARADLEEKRRAAQEELARAGVSLSDETAEVPRMPLRSSYDEANQMSNPVRILTSGIERSTGGQPFYASNKWRLVRRVPWWREYTSDVPVVFGHYWRRYTPANGGQEAAHPADLFGDAPPDRWLGNTMCVDYSVGYRFAERQERADAAAPRASRYCLAALQVPEWRVVFDDGRPPFQIGAPPRGPR